MNDKLQDYIKYAEYIVYNETNSMTDLMATWKENFDDFTENQFLKLENTMKDMVNENQCKADEQRAAFKSTLETWESTKQQKDQNLEKLNKESMDASLVALLTMNNDLQDLTLKEWMSSQRDVYLVQQQLDRLKAICLINSEKVEHNLEILKKQEIENSLVLSELKRRKTNLSDKLTKLKLRNSNLALKVDNSRHLNTEKTENGTRKLKESKNSQMFNLDQLNKNYDKLWELKEKQMTQLINDINCLNNTPVNVSTNSLQVSVTTQLVLKVISKDDLQIIQSYVQDHSSILPQQYLQVPMTKDDFIQLQLEYFLKHFSISSVFQFLITLKSLKHPYSITSQLTEQEYEQYWQHSIPGTHQFDSTVYSTQQGFKNYQLHSKLIVQLQQLTIDNKYLQRLLT